MSNGSNANGGPGKSVDGEEPPSPVAPALSHGHPIGFPLDDPGPYVLSRVRITKGDIARIVDLDSDLLRVRATAMAYDRLDGQLHDTLGIPEATWWTFAKWATATIAWSIDETHGWQPLNGEPRPHSSYKRLIPPHKLIVSNQFLAQANRYVFDEMGSLAVTICEEFPSLQDMNAKELQDFVRTIEPTSRMGIFGQGSRELLQHGVASLIAAARPASDPNEDDDSEERSGLVYVSNVAFFEYEQRRLQAYLEVLLSGRPFRKWIELRDVVTYGQGNRVVSRTSRMRGRASTRFMKMQLPDEVVKLSKEGKHNKAKSDGGDKTEPFGPNLRNLSPADGTYLERWPASSKPQLRLRRRHPVTVDRDWRQLHWRMEKIGMLFARLHNDDSIRGCPYSEEEAMNILKGIDPQNSPVADRNFSSSDPDLNRKWTHDYLDTLRRLAEPEVTERRVTVTADRVHNRDLSDLTWIEAVEQWVDRHNHLELHEMLRVILAPHDVKRETIDDIVKSELLEAPPERLSWVSDDDVRAARRFFRSQLPAIGTGLVFGSLPADLAAADGARVVHQSGYLLKDTSSRIQRTTDFVMQVMNTGIGRVSAKSSAEFSLVRSDSEEAKPFADPKGPSLLAVRRTRVTHQVVRSWIRSQPSAGPIDHWSPSWDSEEEPINVEDQIGTILSFTVVLWDALRNLGVDPDLLAEYKEPWYRTWCLVGLNLGIPADELPRNFDDARKLAELLASRHLRPSQAGFELGRSLIREVHRSLPAPFGWLFRPVARSFSSSAIRAVTDVSEEKKNEYPWEIAKMLALPESRIIRPSMAKFVLRSAMGMGPLGLPRGVASRMIIRSYGRRGHPHAERPT